MFTSYINLFCDDSTECQSPAVSPALQTPCDKQAHETEGRKVKASRKHLIMKEVKAHFDVSSHAIDSFSIFESQYRLCAAEAHPNPTFLWTSVLKMLYLQGKNTLLLEKKIKGEKKCSCFPVFYLL